MSSHLPPTVDTRPDDRVDPAYVATAPDYGRQLSSPTSSDPHAHFIPPALLQTSSASSLPDHNLPSPLASPQPLPRFDEDKEDRPPTTPYTNGVDGKEKALPTTFSHSLTIPDSKLHPPPSEHKEDPAGHKADVEDHHGGGPADVSNIAPEVLTTDPRLGLTTDVATARLTQYGYNEIQEHKPSKLLKFLGYFTGSIAYLIEAAAILSGALQDWTDFGIITALLFVNAFIGFMEESKAESAVDALKSTLALRCRVMRDGHMVEMEARCIVPGDIISLRTGDVISADAIVLPRVHKNAVYKGMGFAEHEELADGQKSSDDDHDDQPVELSADQSALTGESLPTMKHPRDLLYSSSIVKSGMAMALVIKTGENTFVGRAANLIAITTDAGHFQKVIQKIGNFLVAITIVMVVIILIVGTTAQGHSFTSTLQNSLVICIASIPVGLPTVLSVTMAVGAKQLAAKQVIVKRLTAVEEMAGIDILCSDKTGTLTKNELQIDKPYLVAGYNQLDLLLWGFLASEHATKDAIDLCLRRAACDQVPALKEAGLQADSPETPGYHILKHEPFTSSTKMATTALRDMTTKEVFMVAKGAPQVILRMCKLPPADHKKADDAIIQMARQGLRALGIAVTKPYTGKAPANIKDLDWQLVGCCSLLDPPRDDSAETIRRCNEFGIGVKMITGDTILIGKEVAKRLGMNRNILSPAIIQTAETAAHGHGEPAAADAPPAPVYTEKQLIHMVRKADGFGQVVPEDKYRVVEILQNGGHLVGMTGDGVNDAPALKKANVGIAVHGCTDAARAAAAIVLLQPGLGTIADGVMTSRQIFQRMRSYSLYRITSTIHFLIFLFIAIIAFDFTIPAVLIVLITVMNDAATLVISVDNAQISHRPDKWRIGQLIFLSFVLAILLAIASFAHFFIFKYALGSTDDELGTIMYLQMSSCPHFVIFSTRLPRAWYTQPPSLIFFVAVMGTQVIAMFFAVYGVLSTAIGWPSSLAIMAVSLIYFMFLDQVKLFVYAHWSFELTVKMWPTKARKELRDEKRVLRAIKERFIKGARVGRRQINVCKFVLLCKEAVEASHLTEVVVVKKAPDMPTPVKYTDVEMIPVQQ